MFDDDEIEHGLEEGRISDSQARAAHAANDLARGDQ